MLERGAFLLLVGVGVGCGPSTAAPASAATTPAPTAETSPPPAAANDGRQVCEAVMKRTRECGELYVPALLRTRARYDQPPGIAARYAKDGEAVLLPIAREEFAKDWSDEGIDAHCDALDAKDPADRKAIVERERVCLRPGDDCAAFVECNMASLAKKWSAQSSDAGATPASAP
jgi:hypothetical protein